MAANQRDQRPAKKKAAAGTGGTGKSTDAILFRRKEHVPRRIMSSADLWLELFKEYHAAVVTAQMDPDRTKLPFRSAEEGAEWAVLQADAGLAAYENRWPNVEPPSQS